MKKNILTLILAATGMQAAAQCDGDRYRNFIFPDFVKTSDIIYGENINVDGDLEQLAMDVYVPESDISTERALIIIAHGGYFLGGDKGGTDVVPFCEDFAKMGFTVASINYRIGLELEEPLNEPYGQTVVRAVQDLRAAIRWFRQDAEAGTNQFGIDPQQIYSGGVSAGGFMSIHLAYMDEEEIPDWIDMTAEGLEGGLEGESGNPGYSSEVNAIFNVSGAIGDTAWIDAGELPACLFHGDNDQVVPFDSDLFVLFGLVEVTDLDGSNSIHEKLTQVGIEHCFEVNEGFGHVPHVGNPEVYDTTLSILSNFLSHHICDIELDCTYRDLTVGVENEDDGKFSAANIWPNPAGESLTIECGQPALNFRIVDLSGRILIDRSADVRQTSIDVTEVAPGVYIVETDYADGRRDAKKLVIE